MKQIASRDNARYKALKKLAESGRERRKAGRIVLDGMHLVESYREIFGLPEEIVVSASGAARSEIATWLSLHPQAQVICLEDVLFNTLTGVDTPSGILAVAVHPKARCPLAQESDTIVLDGVQDPGNLGSMLRSAAAAGFTQAVLSADCAQAWAPKTLRAAMGAHFQIDIHENCDLPAFLNDFLGRAILTALDGSVDVFELDLSWPVAWVFGNEGQGVRSEVANAVRLRARIPMLGPTESLNVAAAAAICLFETVRQRRC